MQRVRHSVKENRLTSCVITDEEVVAAIEVTGRGWVVEVDGEVRAFAVGNAQTGNIWALFVEPGYERRGFGRRLQDEMLAWLWSRGLERLWLSTEPETRARRFYEASGWERRGTLPGGELLFERYADSGGALGRLKRRVRDLKRETHALYLAGRHPRTPWYAKALVAVVVAYAVSPIDLIPDFIPVVGLLDDLLLIPAGVVLAVRLIPPDVLAECRAQAEGAIEGGGRAAMAAIIAIWVGLAVLLGLWAFEALGR
jgi:uncharacterized membrane protein YkvA (DUF1232 family)